MVCSICGRPVLTWNHQLRLYKEESYWRWMWRHVKSFVCKPFARPGPADGGGLVICAGCYCELEWGHLGEIRSRIITHYCNHD